MSIFGSMKTAVSGMNAQANRLSTVADNIANVDTIAYKRVSLSFASMVVPPSTSNYNSGGVQTFIRQAVSGQGALSYTASGSNLSIKGDGFFIVRDASGAMVLTRAGDFGPDSQGNLVNSSGFILLGYRYDAGEPGVVVNGFTDLVPINLSAIGLTAEASSSGSLSGNLKATAEIVAGDTPAANMSTSAYSFKTSIVAYDRLGSRVLYDVYFTKTAGSEFEVAAFRSEASLGSAAFPYQSGPTGTASLVFNDRGQPDGPTLMQMTDGDLMIELDFSKITQVAAAFSMTGKVGGKGASPTRSFTISHDGLVSALYQDGSIKPLYRIPLAMVASPDMLTLLSGNVYAPSAASGVTVTAFPQSGGMGSIVSGSLEMSNVDLAQELTEMIVAQRGYVANSKVFQTAADLLDVLVNLKR